MPIYEYECQKCQKLMEVLQKASDPGPKKCEKCGSKKVQRVMSQTSFQLKGTGWYLTDYSRKDKDNSAKAKAKKRESDSGETKSEPKNDSKTEAKSESKAEAKTEKPEKKASSAGSTSP